MRQCKLYEFNGVRAKGFVPAMPDIDSGCLWGLNLARARVARKALRMLNL